MGAAYDKILERCESYRLAREDVPTMIVFSDMQFNVAYSKVDYWQPGPKGTAGLATMHQEIRRKFATTARKLGWSDPDPTPIVIGICATPEDIPSRRTRRAPCCCRDFRRP